jgi:CO/xanthine dehydrogenase Mo-binding subunit
LAVESALDELSYALGIDPIELRLRNYTEVHPGSGRPWSSKALSPNRTNAHAE